MSLMKYVSGLILLFSMSACSNLNVSVPSFDELLSTQTKQDGRACIRQNNIRGYGLLDDRVISVNASGPKRYYLVTTLLQCHSLRTSFAAGFNGRFSELCGGGRDSIITADEACPIKSIFAFESREEAFANFNTAEQTRKDLREASKQNTNDLPSESTQ